MHTMMMVACNTHNLFNRDKLEEGDQTTVNHNVVVMDVLSWMRDVLALFKVLTNYEIYEFDELASLACYKIYDNCRSMVLKMYLVADPWATFAQLHHVFEAWRQHQCLVSFIFMKHNHVISYDCFQWNVARSTLWDDVVFIALCVTYALAHSYHDLMR